MLPSVLADGHSEVHPGCACKAGIEIRLEVAGLVEHIVGRQQLLAADDLAAAAGPDAHRAVGRLGALAARVDRRADQKGDRRLDRARGSLTPLDEAVIEQ